jgi:CAAX prenyl protease-like protein
MDSRPPTSSHAKPGSWLDNPEVPRALPFVLFLLIGTFAGQAFPGSEYWLYAAKTIGVGGLLWVWRHRLPEMRWAVSIEAIGVGLAIAVLWLGLDGRIPSLGGLWDLGVKLFTGKAPAAAKAPEVWNPIAFFKDQPALGYALLAVRVLGRSLVVPAMEEVFYRSFFYRYVISPKFVDLPLNTRSPKAWIITSVIFGACHPDHWVPGILCGLAYQWLVLRRGRLGDAMLAHAVTNLAISGYAIVTGRWEFS